MQQSNPTILIVDDEVFNLDIIEEYLEDEDQGYRIVRAEDGVMAWSLLENDPGSFDVILLDRMMPKLDGMEVLARIKTHSVLCSIPVILQTARAGKQDIVAGLKAGAFYYLTKPFEGEMLRSVVQTALQDRARYKEAQKEVYKHARIMGMMQSGHFHFCTLEQGRNLASMLANACPDPSRAVSGLSELMINAVEHGNLAITYEQKSVLNKNGNWEAEVNRRLAIPENACKVVEVDYARVNGEILITITDQGEGFDWRPFMELSAERAFDTHGRGIAMSRLLSFDRLEYRGNGNEVLAVLNVGDEKGENNIC
jgi:CheY-like chemotaxis protein/anti-sigma regulatory factor (Ser/Thr protein kinase)